MGHALRLSPEQADELLDRLKRTHDKPGDVAVFPGGVSVKREKKPRDDAEHREQVEVIKWAHATQGRVPELRWLFAIPNGGWRTKATAGKLKAEGVKPGVPDLHLPYPTARHVGLWIEMKAAGGTVSKEQREWIDHLNSAGYRAEVCKGARAAILLLCEYLDLDPCVYAKAYAERAA